MTPEQQINAINQILRAMELVHYRINQLGGYMARQEMHQIREQLKDQPQRLEHFGFKVYSQNDEDGILEEIFQRLNITAGTFCEIGVENGLECNTLYLLHQGWRGLWLEGNPRQQAAIESKFQPLLQQRQLRLAVAMVTPENIQALIEQHCTELGLQAQELDFLSIDVDGMDIHLWEALTIRPKVICIEYNAKFPARLSKRPVYSATRSWQGTDYMGSSLKALTDSATARGYTLVATNITGVNAFYVRTDALNDRFAGPFTAQHLYNPARYYCTTHHFNTSMGHPADFGPYEK